MAQDLTGWQPGSARAVAGRLTVRRTANSVDACEDDRHQYWGDPAVGGPRDDRGSDDLRNPSESRMHEVHPGERQADEDRNRDGLPNAAGTAVHEEHRRGCHECRVPAHCRRGNHPIAHDGIHLRVVRVVAPTGDGHLADYRRSDH